MKEYQVKKHTLLLRLVLVAAIVLILILSTLDESKKHKEILFISLETGSHHCVLFFNPFKFNSGINYKKNIHHKGVSVY